MNNTAIPKAEIVNVIVFKRPLTLKIAHKNEPNNRNNNNNKSKDSGKGFNT